MGYRCHYYQSGSPCRSILLIGRTSSDLHGTTSINGVYQKDPKGPHITLCYKDDENMRKGTHVACHGYVKDEETMEFKEATDRGEKLDTTKKKNKQSVWPASEELWAAPDIGYGHWD